MDRIQRLVQGMQGGGQGGPPADTPQVDTAEQIYISSLALLKMLKHGGCRSGLVHLLALPGRQGGGASACRACSPPRPTPPLLLPLLERLSTRLPSPPALVASSGTPPPLAPPGRAGVPMEVMGLMLGEFVDDYTVKVGPGSAGCRPPSLTPARPILPAACLQAQAAAQQPQ
jgi:hypothetical protein